MCCFLRGDLGVERCYIYNLLYIHIGALMKFHKSYDFLVNIQAFNVLALPDSESDDLPHDLPNIARMELRQHALVSCFQ